MTHAIRMLRLDHENMTKLFNLMESQLRELGDGKAPDFPLLEDMADYFSGYPDQCHHPKEDIIFRKLEKRNPAAADDLRNLLVEHQSLSVLIERFAEILKGAQANPDASIDEFVATMRNLVDYYKQHMHMEEVHFFPKALEIMSADDWAEVNFAISEQDDPLFDEAVTKFQKLRNEIFRLANVHNKIAASQSLFDVECKELEEQSTIADFNKTMIDGNSGIQLIRCEDGGYRLGDRDTTLIEIPECSEIQAVWCSHYFLKGRGLQE